VNDAASDVAFHGKRLLILFPHMVVPGGGLNYALHLAEFLVAQGAQVGILTMRHDSKTIAVPDGVAVLSAGGMLTDSLLYWGLFPYWQHKLGALINDWQPDVLIPQVFPANWWGWLYRRKHEVPLLWVCHEPSPFIHSNTWIAAIRPFWKMLFAKALNPVLKQIDLQLSRVTDVALANSRFTATELRRIYGADAAAIVYPGIDFSLFCPGDVPRQQAIVTVAALSSFKRVDFLLRVFAHLLPEHPELVYYVVGSGNEEEALQVLAKELGIAAQVCFLGKLAAAELAEVQRKSLLFLHGAIEEPFGLAPLEAIACGTPVVAHNSGGPAEFINSACGLLVAGESVDAWAQQVSVFLSFLKSNPGYYRTVSDEAAGFSWGKTLLPIIGCLKKLLADRKD
jgi:glycosyltransferase involved in cell wall biosynthesis